MEAIGEGAERALVFIGFMGAGKTTGARAAAAALGVRAVDTDRELEQRLGTSIEDYFASHGERAFREAEEDIVAEVLESPPAPVISIGGGAIGSSRVRELLARHTVVLLDVDEPTAWRRAGGKRRPLARDRERFAALHAERGPVYEALADAVLLDGGAETVRRAASALRRIPPGVKLLWAVAGESNYPVYIGDVLDGRFWPLRGRRFLITDETVGALHGGRLPAVDGRLEMPPGEVAKTLAEAERLLRGLAAAGMDHDDHVAALGGGVVGDVAGFCAAVYQRGVGVVQIPTTLVSQVDSAYGGKTGVDLPEGKNYVGAYHQPRAVLADPRTLESLPAEELAAGWAEVIKTALIAGGALWSRVRRGDTAVDRDLVLACARTKLGVVARDERDAGRRQVLNLGHTVGHAIETATGYRRYRHGEAVGLGLLAALTLSGQPDLRGEVGELLEAHGLPTAVDADLDHDAVLAAVQRDKKRRGGRVGFVLVEAPGDVRTGAPVSEADVRAALGGLR
jgi:shikimate kinase/3-dehydroquinate synthase